MTRRMAIPMFLALLLLTLSARAERMAPLPRVPAGMSVAGFAAGCFWCSEHDFEQLPGVLSVTSGYTGGTKKNPTYEEVSDGGTGHAESIYVIFDPRKVSYARLLDAFWHNVDPFNTHGQFCDNGNQYRSEIFVFNAEQKRLAEASRVAVEGRFKKPVATRITQASTFWPAEEYHQDYAMKNPVRYKFYRYNCGRDARLQELWGKK